MTRTLPFLALLFPATPALAEPIVGRATVIDGGALEVRGTRIRLHGIDALESGQACKAAGGKAHRCARLRPSRWRIASGSASSPASRARATSTAVSSPYAQRVRGI
ncbi:hypothetical protein [Methylobacterium iners]|uniref:Nuclease n=1 Tax=Methylobacterium iners TaxID=418707 RepID=A0ABQ4RRP3_9HYPH|nr:hypothetical protein [Methylobacterium iners]GJD93446.1 hypothetical protein OCOJLMKI_0640 [Methylobacterium iners]